jgi:hypothetical protein
MPKLIAKCGFNRNTAKAVLAGPIELGGGGFTPLYTTSGSGRIRTTLSKELENTNRRHRQATTNNVRMVCISGRSIIPTIGTSARRIALCQRKSYSSNKKISSRHRWNDST